MDKVLFENGNVSVSLRGNLVVITAKSSPIASVFVSTNSDESLDVTFDHEAQATLTTVETGFGFSQMVARVTKRA